MKVFKAIIVEDEPLAVADIEAEIESLQFIDVVSVADNLADAEKEILFHKPDILFLDINIKNKPVFHLLNNLEKWKLKFGVLFITAHHDKYIMEAVNNCGWKYRFQYMSKPVHTPEFLQKLNQVRKGLLEDAGESDGNGITIKYQGGMVRLLYDEIFYCETAGNDSIIYLTDESKEVIPNKNLSKIELLLPAQHFYRISSSHIINRYYFRKSYASDNEKYFCNIQTGILKKKLPIPKKQYAGFKKAFEE